METGEFEDAGLSSSMPEQSSTSALVAMIACNAMLLLMLAACSPPAHAEVPALRASDVDDRTFNLVIPLGRLTVVPQSEDAPPPAKGRWQRFEEALNATGSRKYRAVESATNTGIRVACYEPCLMNCCVSSGGFSLAGQGFGR